VSRSNAVWDNNDRTDTSISGREIRFRANNRPVYGF
jgi:hypothetical protein